MLNQRLGARMAAAPGAQACTEKKKWYILVYQRESARVPPTPILTSFFFQPTGLGCTSARANVKSSGVEWRHVDVIAWVGTGIDFLILLRACRCEREKEKHVTAGLPREGKAGFFLGKRMCFIN
jgi:hypothetical protein